MSLLQNSDGGDCAYVLMWCAKSQHVFSFLCRLQTVFIENVMKKVWIISCKFILLQMLEPKLWFWGVKWWPVNLLLWWEEHDPSPLRMLVWHTITFCAEAIWAFWLHLVVLDSSYHYNFLIPVVFLAQVDGHHKERMSAGDGSPQHCCTAISWCFFSFGEREKCV